MLPSGPSPCTWLSHAPSTTPDTTPHQHPAGFPFHGTSLPPRLRLPVCRVGSGIAPCPGFPLRASITVYPASPFSRSGAHGASQVLRRICSCMPQPEDSGRSPHPRHFHGCFVLASGTLKPWPSTTSLFRSCTNFQGTRLPLRPTGFSVYASPVLFGNSSCLRHRRNTRYGWVASPCPARTRTQQDTPSFSWRCNAGHNRAPAREARREPNGERSDAVRRSGSCPCWAANSRSRSPAIHRIIASAR